MSQMPTQGTAGSTIAGVNDATPATSQACISQPPGQGTATAIGANDVTSACRAVVKPKILDVKPAETSPAQLIRNSSTQWHLQRNSYSRWLPFVHYDFREDDLIALVPYAYADTIWCVLTSGAEKHFLHEDSYALLGLPAPQKEASQELARQDQCPESFIVALFESKEKCLTQKMPNRFNLPIDCIFFQVKVRCVRRQ